MFVPRPLLILSILTACVTPMQRHFEGAQRCRFVQKDHACAIAHYTWMLEHGAPTALIDRAQTRLEAGDRRGALADADEAVARLGSMSAYMNRANIRADLQRVRQVGAQDAAAHTDPPLDFAGAVDDFTGCIARASRTYAREETWMLHQCFKGRRDVKRLLGRDASDDDAAFKRIACGECDAGIQCDTESGCELNMQPARSSSGSWSTSSGSPSQGGGGGAWYYSWSCTGQCSPGQLAIKGTEGPFPTEDGCNAARNGDSRRDLVKQSGNVGSVGYCERR
jgi:hypothetical protein